MEIQLEKKLKRKYPRVFRKLHNKKVTIYNSCIAWGLECGDGWYKLLDECAATIEKEIDNWLVENAEWMKEHPEFCPDCIPCAEQVKEKFGTLRFYMNSENEGIRDAIRKAEVESEVTCEECGKPGIIRGKGWMYVGCDECEEKREQRLRECNEAVVDGRSEEELPTA